MNGTGVKGGAFGFRVSSINKLVDTKSVNNTTLLHFLERTVAKHFPELEEFLDELAKPAEAYRVNLFEVRKNLAELREGLKKIRVELNEHFAELERNDRYSKQMWSFLGKATQRLEDLVDDVNTSDTTYAEVISYFGEEDKNMSSSEFYGIFKTFITSYKVRAFRSLSHVVRRLTSRAQKCQMDNRTAAEERMAVEKRRQAVEDRKKALEHTTEQAAEDNAALDTLLEKLRNGDSVGRRHRRDRARPSGASVSLRPSLPAIPATADDVDPADRARGLLEQLKAGGFMSADMLPPPSPMVAGAPRRRRMRSGSMMELAAELEAAGSPLTSPSEMAVSEASPDLEEADEDADEGQVVEEADTSMSEHLQLAARASLALEAGDG
jgi:cytokinesis protein